MATDPDAATIERVVRGLSWSAMTFVVLHRENGDLCEVSGSLDPADGLSARSVEDGEERISREAPESEDLLVRLLQSYAAGDDRWRTMIAWDS
jgi:hypothetical protein